MCKHKDAFLNNDAAMFFDDSDNELLETIYKMIGASNFLVEFAAYQVALDEIEKRKKELAKEANKLRRFSVGDYMREFSSLMS